MESSVSMYTSSADYWRARAIYAERALADLGVTPEEAAKGAIRSAENQRDAVRYRFLRTDFSPMGLNIDGNHAWAYRRNATLRGPSLDAAIDAAMAVGDA